MPRRPLDPSRVVTLVVRWMDGWKGSIDSVIRWKCLPRDRDASLPSYRPYVRTTSLQRRARGRGRPNDVASRLAACRCWLVDGEEGTDGGDTDNAGGWRHVPACAPWPERGMDSIHNGEASAPSGALTRLLDENSKRQRRAPRAGPPLRTYYYLLTAAMFRCPGSPRFP